MQVIDAALEQITQAFYPKPLECQINGKTYLIERIPAGWTWRNEDGNFQEDFGIKPFPTAAEAQQSAMDNARAA